MLAGLLLAALSTAPPLSATEHELLEKGRQQGQWAAFRTYVAPDAWLLDPDLTPARQVLETRADPQQARDWAATRTVTSCDGSLAFSTGNYRAADGNGRFFTIWERQPDRSWRWIFDGTVEDGARPGPAGPAARTAACLYVAVSAFGPTVEAAGAAGDGTLRWELGRALDREKRRLLVTYYTTKGWTTFEDATVR